MSAAGRTYILDLVHGEVGIGRHAGLLWLYVDDDQQGVGGVALEQLVDLEVGCAQLGAGVVPAY